MNAIEDVEVLASHLGEMLDACFNLMNFVDWGARPDSDLRQDTLSPVYIDQETKIIITYCSSATEIWREVPLWLKPFQPAPVRIGSQPPCGSYVECAIILGNSLLFFLDNPELPISTNWDHQEFQAARKLFGTYITEDPRDLFALGASLQIELRTFARFVRGQTLTEFEPMGSRSA